MSLIADRSLPLRTTFSLRRKRAREKAPTALSEFFSTITIGLPALAAFALLWEVAPRAGWINSLFFPPLSQVLAVLWEMIVSGQLADHIGISLQRAAIGFALAVVTAVPLGFLMGRYPLFERASDFLVQTLRNTSQFALLPVFILL
ncbi:MAG: ABC transporter permease, partial [Shinella sp.]